MRTIATIPLACPFLDHLVRWWRDTSDDGPLGFSDGLILVPTRRAARALAEAFLRAGDGQPTLLPRIEAIGAPDEVPLALASSFDLPPAIGQAERLTTLARLILARDSTLPLPQAWRLAGELARLLDDAAREGVDLAEKLPEAAGREWAQHWQVTLAFLEIVTHHWPAHLIERGLEDPVKRQVRAIDAFADHLRATQPAHRIVAAGTTGAIPAVQRLLAAILTLPRGALILPGLDHELDAESWDALEPTHPQAAIGDLLVQLGLRREDVSVLDQAPDELRAERDTLLRRAMLPATSLHRWQLPSSLSAAGLHQITPADQEEEAGAIALLLRETLQSPGARAALVTPDRALAQRVAAELLRFGVVVDDSAGEALRETPPAAFLQLLAKAVAEQFRPVALLALLKHPFAAGGGSRDAFRDETRRLERRHLRGPRPPPGLAALRALADTPLLEQVETCLSPLLALGSLPQSPQIWLTALIRSAEALAATDAMPGTRLWAMEEGEALADRLAEVLPALASLPSLPLADLPALLEAVLEGAAVRSRRALRGREGGEHPRVFIWGLLEARLQTADRIVLGGLVEGVWPPVTDPGPWMSRAMRRGIGLRSPEEAVGAAAHDFCALSCAASEVVLSTPKRRDRAPAVPSRFIARLTAMPGASIPLHPAVAWRRALDQPSGRPRPVAPPCPRPPVSLRPRRLSVTGIETWLRDPYAIFAEHVLHLRPLDDIELPADFSDYGTVVHGALKDFFERHGEAWPADGAAEIEAGMMRALDAARIRPALAVWWRPRLARIAAWIAAKEEEGRAAEPHRRTHAEITGTWVFQSRAGAFTLTARADRIDCLEDGTATIIDYKTGTMPTGKQVREGLAPQLPLEAVILDRNGFPGLSCRPGALAYWQLTGGDPPGTDNTLFKRSKEDVRAIADHAAERLRALVDAYDDERTPYLARPNPATAARFPRYARLARVAEWEAAGESE